MSRRRPSRVILAQKGPKIDDQRPHIQPAAGRAAPRPAKSPHAVGGPEAVIDPHFRVVEGDRVEAPLSGGQPSQTRSDDMLLIGGRLGTCARTAHRSAAAMSSGEGDGSEGRERRRIPPRPHLVNDVVMSDRQEPAPKGIQCREHEGRWEVGRRSSPWLNRGSFPNIERTKVVNEV